MTYNNFVPLDNLPRTQIAHLPTPIDPLRSLTAYLGGPELFIKRDDQTGLATGGNKAARQTAAAAARYGLECHLVLYAPNGTPPHDITGNLLLIHLLGATVHWTDEPAPYAETIAQVKRDQLDEGHRPYVIPYGGSNPYGLLGYAAAMREFKAQARGLDPFDTHVFATSSGGTQAGMILGAHLAGLAQTSRILGISVDLPAPAVAARVTTLANGAAQLLGLDWQLEPADVLVNDQYVGAGYAIVGEPEREAVHLMAHHEGILLDPVYTGRAFAGLIDLIRRGDLTAGQRVLFWHTGGSAALFAFVDDLL
jgi:1-aminocyclopropane-1-carboxylate deaminase/D-cysteine desulfhydrase-like pyridoxal-dependent ACC family enzyme